jgi:hypothetical protein
VYAWWICTMVATKDGKVAAYVWELTDLHRLHPRPVHAEGDVILRLTGCTARVAPDAFGLVDDPRVVHGPDIDRNQR